MLRTQHSVSSSLTQQSHKQMLPQIRRRQSKYPLLTCSEHLATKKIGENGRGGKIQEDVVFIRLGSLTIYYKFNLRNRKIVKHGKWIATPHALRLNESK